MVRGELVVSMESKQDILSEYLFLKLAEESYRQSSGFFVM